MKILHTNNYIKIGLIISLILHIGIFALGGYIMHNLTKPVDTTTEQAQNDDITYVDMQNPDTNSTDEVTIPANPQSDVIIDDEQVSETPKPIQQPPKENPPQPKAEAPKQTPPPSEPTKKQDEPAKLPTYKDIKIPIKKVEENLKLNENDLRNSIDLMPKVIYKANPEYDPSWIPKGEEIVVIISYTLDAQGNVTSVYVESPAETSAKLLGTSLASDINEAINTRAIEAVIASKIQPPKNPEGNGPYQIPISFTNP